jgi:hypothetical protein
MKISAHQEKVPEWCDTRPKSKREHAHCSTTASAII